jgi:hypothetical protein
MLAVSRDLERFVERRLVDQRMPLVGEGGLSYRFIFFGLTKKKKEKTSYKLLAPCWFEESIHR